MSLPIPAMNTWIKIKKVEKDENDKDQWSGRVENVSSTGITICNGVSGTGGGAETAHVLWEEMKDWSYYDKDELYDYYAGSENSAADELMEALAKLPKG